MKSYEETFQARLAESEGEDKRLLLEHDMVGGEFVKLARTCAKVPAELSDWQLKEEFALGMGEAFLAAAIPMSAERMLAYTVALAAWVKGISREFGVDFDLLQTVAAALDANVDSVEIEGQEA